MSVVSREVPIETPAEVRAQCEKFRDTFKRLKDEVGKVVVGHSSVVEFDAGIDGAKEFLHGCNQLGFTVKVGKFGGGVFQDWFGSSGHELPPVHGDAKQQVHVTGSSPVFDEGLDLLETL